MATFNGHFTAEHLLGVRSPTTFNGFVDNYGFGTKSTVSFNGFTTAEHSAGLRQTKIVPVVLVQPFYWDESLTPEEIGVKQPNEFKGFFTWGDGNIPPRRSPLEISWRNPKK